MTECTFSMVQAIHKIYEVLLQQPAHTKYILKLGLALFSIKEYKCES